MVLGRVNEDGRKVFLFAVILSMIAGFTYWKSPLDHSPDSRWVLPTAHSILSEGNIGLNEYLPTIRKIGTYALLRKRKEFVNYFPVGPALMAVPLVWIIDHFPERMSYFLGVPVDGSGEMLLRHRRVIEHFIASVIAACVVGVCFLTLTPFISIKWSLALTVAVGWGSSLWSVASRGLWQHGPAMLCLFGALAFLVRLECSDSENHHQRSWGLAIGVILGAAYLMRPTAIIGLAAILVVLFLNHRIAFLYAILGGSVIAAFFFWSNLERYGHILPPYYQSGKLRFSSTTPEALCANLFSPSRGLLILSSWTLIGFLAPPRKDSPLRCCLWGWFGLHLLIVSMFDHWWAGHSFGPRFMSEAVPPLIVLSAISIAQHAPARLHLSVVVSLLIGTSILAHAPGALSRATMLWLIYPRNIDEDPSRIWSVRRMQSAAPLYLRVGGPRTLKN